MPAGYRSSDYSCDNDVIRISGDDYEKLSLICRESSCSVQSVLMALAAVTVGVLKKKNNFCFYSLCHGRATYPLKKTVGCMVSTVPIFFNIKDEITLKELFRDSYMDYLETMSHAHMPFSKHISMSMMQSLKNRFNFCHGWMQFSAMDYQKIISGLSFFADLTNKPLQCNQFYCGVLDVPAEKCVTIFLKYQTGCFNKAQVRRIMETYEKLIIAAAHDPDLSVGELKGLAE